MITKQQLGNTLWGMAEILYDKVEDYETYILSLLFFKRLSDNWTREIDNKMYSVPSLLLRKIPIP